jgi:predicted nucleic acid-binding protein
MLTTWPAFTEAMYLAGREGGWKWQDLLWNWVEAGSLVVHEATASMLARMPALMERYRDLPMDLADASLVALAEERRLRQVFTLDADFRVYRAANGAAFELIPAF